jgi:hypothetical protein
MSLPKVKKKLIKKKLKLQDHPNSDKKFIIIQIDGLSYSHLKKVLEKKRMPYMKEILKTNKITHFDPGFPTHTYSVQAQMFYGNNTIIPNFVFFDKKTRKKLSMGSPHSCEIIQKRLDTQRGLLKGGTSINSGFTGGAARSITTLSKLSSRYSKIRTVGGILYIGMLMPWRLFSALFFASWEVCSELIDSFFDVFKYIFKGKSINSPFLYPYFPLWRAFLNTAAREVSTQGALLEIDRNSPRIFINYTGFDTICHYRGPEAKSSYTVLREIDFDIKKVYKKAKEKNYDVYVMSDHGQLPSIPFEKNFYESFGEFIDRCIDQKGPKKKATDYKENHSMYFFYKLKYTYKHFSLPLRILSKAFLFGFSLFFPATKETKNPVVNKDVVVLPSSSLTNIYFNQKKTKMERSDIEALYPDLLLHIIHHPGVGFVIVSEKEKVHVMSAEGSITISKDESVVKVGEDFLQVYGDEKNLVKQILHYMTIDYCGDVVVNGKFDGKNIVAFDNYQFGAHNGMGGEQHDAFFVSKEKIDLPSGIDATVLFDYLSEKYGL